MKKKDIAQTVIDALERVGNNQDYYRLNHVKGADIDRLAELVEQWARSVNVEIKGNTSRGA